MENYVIYDELVNRCSTIEGGVNNVQGTLDASNLISADSVVKSVQRGVLTGKKNLQNQKWINLTTISPVDTEKAMLNVCCTLVTGTRPYSQFAYQLNGDKIQIYFSNGSSGDFAMMIFSWEIIEFY